MNAVQLLATASTSSKVNKIGNMLHNQKVKADSNEFSQLLDSVIHGSSIVEKAKQNDLEGSSLTATEMVPVSDIEIKWDELLSAFDQLFETLPMLEGFIDPELLQDADLLGLFNQIPLTLQQLLTEFIQTGSSFEGLLSQTEKGSLEQLGLLLITAYQLDKKGQFPEQFEQKEIVKVIQNLINDKLGVHLTSNPVNVSTFLKELVPLIEKKSSTELGKNKIPMIADQPIQQSNTEIRQAIQNVLYSSSAESNNRASNNDPHAPVDKITNLNQSAHSKQTVDVDIFDQLLTNSVKDGGSVNRIQQYVLTVQQPGTGSTLPEDQILKQLKNIMSQSKLTTSINGTNQLLIKLNPAHLGSLTIKLSETNGEMVARIIASSATAKEVIESNLNSLRHVFSTQNISVEKFDIQYQGDSQFKGSNKEDSQQHESKQKQQDTDNLKDDSSNSNSFQEELFNMMI
ncbi:flagellar hook-length control protein FliK [Bacillus sp. Marseille-P3661]|uniref:flagellar hook-length control protein FliK n=1 Tax=Bacillus sp. Marseille-P3661 TaxID=1936234 RepID=UPI000C83861A|nr:flagellar hook-length control protein FliK [Bacillus sp. Marseille-P3661]